MNKLRISYTMLKLWQQSRIDDLLIYYFKMGKVTNKYMEKGIEFDRYTNSYVEKNNTLPPELGGDKLIDPKPQQKWVAPYNELFDLVCVPDIIDGKTMYEVKTGGSKDSADYSLDFQIGIYLVMAGLKEIEIDRAIILHYHNSKLDKTLIWNSKEERNRARNFIDSLAPEIYTYFEQNNLFDKKVGLTNIE